MKNRQTREPTTSSPALCACGCGIPVAEGNRWRTGHQARKRQKSLADRLEHNTQKSDGCWIWTGPKGQNGYGYLGIGHAGPRVYAHRLAWELAFGKITDSSLVCHHCDNRLCVRPHHLFLGSTADNTHDMIQKKRHSHGERHTSAKLTAEAVREIRTLIPTVSARDLAIRFGVSSGTIHDIKVRKSWKLLI